MATARNRSAAPAATLAAASSEQDAATASVTTGGGEQSGLVVVAVQRGYYGRLREPGDQFTLAKAEDFGRWMVWGGPAGPAEPTDQWA